MKLVPRQVEQANVFQSARAQAPRDKVALDAIASTCPVAGVTRLVAIAAIALTPTVRALLTPLPRIVLLVPTVSERLDQRAGPDV